MPAPESKSGIALRVLSPGGLRSCANGPSPCPPPSFRRWAFASRRSVFGSPSRGGVHGGLPPDAVKTKDRGLTSTQVVAYTNDNTMARLHSETFSSLAASARVVDGFVTGQSDHRGITLVVECSYSEDKAPGGRKGDWSHAQHLPLRGELLTQYPAGAGSPGERKGTADLCKGIMNASGTFVITRGVRAPGISIFGYSFNPALEFNDTEECKTKMRTYLNWLF